MEWIILFVLSWVLFILLSGWKGLKRTIWCGFFGMALQFFIDTYAISYEMYKVDRKIIHFFGSSAFFIIGPVFTVSVLLARYHPDKWWMRIVNVLAIAALYSIQEALLLTSGALVYLNWKFIYSVGINISVMIALSWFTIVVVQRREGG